MQTTISYAIGLMVIMVIAYVGPGLGEEISTAMPINADGDFASATTGAEIWGSNITILSVVILIVFISLAIKSIMGMSEKKD